MEIGDKVKSHLSLWKGDIGIVSGIIERLDTRGGLVHVIFPENDKHEAYQQSFNENDLILVK